MGEVMSCLPALPIVKGNPVQAIQSPTCKTFEYCSDCLT